MKKIILGKIIGPQGVQGEKGLQGPVGPQGNTGPQGPQGVQGIQGAVGPRGSRWVPGTAIEGIFTEPKVCSGTGLSDSLPEDYYFNPNTGHLYRCTDAGDANTAKWVWCANLRGLQGADGEKGDKGDTGAQGPKGDKGDKGDKGNKGDTGATGATGPQGPKGDTGATGAQGPKGDAGNRVELLAESDDGIVILQYYDTGILFDEIYITVKFSDDDLFAYFAKYVIVKYPATHIDSNWHDYDHNYITHKIYGLNESSIDVMFLTSDRKSELWIRSKKDSSFVPANIRVYSLARAYEE